MSALRLIVLGVNVVGAVFVALIALIALVVTSEGGTLRAVEYYASRLPAEVRFQTVEGTLASGITFGGLSVRSGRDALTARRAELVFSPSSLLARALIVNRLALEQAVFVFGADAAPIDREAKVMLPIVARSAEADTLTLRMQRNEITLLDASLSGRWVGSSVVIDDFRVEHAGVAVLGRGDGAISTKASNISFTPKLLIALPKKTGVWFPFK